LKRGLRWHFPKWSILYIKACKKIIMRPFKDYSVARLVIVVFGIGIIIGALRIAVREIFPASSWTPFLNGAVVGVVVVATIAYFGTGGRDSQLLPKASRKP
jgi:hypothetical protein